MAKVRGVRIKWLSAVNADDSATYNNVLRDILPSKAFKLHGWSCYVKNLAAVLVEFQILKNIANPPGPIAGAAPAPDHGVLAEWATYAAGSYQFGIDYSTPIDFDADDSLNMFFTAQIQGAGNSATIEVILHYSS